MRYEAVGKPLGGAKKYRWKSSGLTLEDLDELNLKEKYQFVKKNNIWKKPNYEELVASGLPIRVAYYMKKIRDSLPAQPTFPYNASADEIEKICKDYTSFVTFFKEEMMKLHNDYDAERFYPDVVSPKYIEPLGYYHYVKVKDEAEGFFPNKLLRALQIGRWETIDYEIKKKQFCYSDKQILLSQYEVLPYSKKDSIFEKMENGNQCMKIKRFGGTRYFYPKGDFADEKNWKDDTFFILQGRTFIANNFEHYRDCEQYIIDHAPDKQGTKRASKTSKKKRFVPPQLEHVVRNGVSYRQGKNISSMELKDTFQFGGNDYGNSVPQYERKEVTNLGYDALMDLSRVLQIDPTNIGFEGELQLGFATSGNGGKNAPIAHFDAVNVEINLTREKGAGSLAHEWGHALDDYIGKKLGFFLKGRTFASEFSYSEKCPKSLKNLMEKMKYKKVEKDGETYTAKTDFFENSKTFDGTYSKDTYGYWASDVEMFARSFACYIMDKLENRSDYLCGHANSAVDYLMDDDGNMKLIHAYPEGEERQVINQCMDEYIRELREKNLLHKFIMELPKEDTLPLKSSAEIDYPDLEEDANGNLALFNMDEELAEGM